MALFCLFVTHDDSLPNHFQRFNFLDNKPLIYLCYTYFSFFSQTIRLEVYPMFEHGQQPLLTSREFLIRQLLYLLVASMIIIGSLMLGVLGYHYLEGLAWIDALVNASMLLGGMGPVNAR